VTRLIALPRALPGKTCAVTIARKTRWDSSSELGSCGCELRPESPARILGLA
jgi:hypothetical protein